MTLYYVQFMNIHQVDGTVLSRGLLDPTGLSGLPGLPLPVDGTIMSRRCLDPTILSSLKYSNLCYSIDFTLSFVSLSLIEIIN